MPSLLGLVNNIENAEMIVAADDFFETNEVPKDCLIHKVILKKNAFKNKSEAVEWLLGKWLMVDQVTETEEGFEAVQIDAVQFVGLKMIEIRRGVFVEVGQIFTYSSPDGYFSLLSNDDIKFKKPEDGAKVKTVIEVATVVDGVHPRFGRVTLTEEDLASFKKNFDNKAFGKDIVFDFDHEEREASGWPKSLFLSEDGKKLFAVVDWTPKGLDSLSNREFRYFSPQFNLNYVKPTTGESFGPTLTGGGITNKPFLDMEPIALNSKGKSEMQIALAEHEKIVGGKDARIKELELSLSQKDKDHNAAIERAKSLEAEVASLNEKTKKAEANAKFEVLLKEGKACEAQREFYLNGDMDGFAASSVKLNMKNNGGGNGNGESEYQLSEGDKAIIKKLGLTEDQYMQANKLGKYSA